MKKQIILLTSIACSIISSPLFCKTEDALLKAVESKKLSLVKKLVKAGAPLNELNEDNKTVLDIAVEKKHTKICRYLVRCGAKVTTQQNALILQNNLLRRGILMTTMGCIFFPTGIISGGLVLGGVLSITDRPLVQVL